MPEPSSRPTLPRRFRCEIRKRNPDTKIYTQRKLVLSVAGCFMWISWLVFGDSIRLCVAFWTRTVLLWLHIACFYPLHGHLPLLWRKRKLRQRWSFERLFHLAQHRFRVCSFSCPSPTQEERSNCLEWRSIKPADFLFIRCKKCGSYNIPVKNPPPTPPAPRCSFLLSGDRLSYFTSSPFHITRWNFCRDSS